MKICAKSGVVEFECEKANAGVEWARLTPPEGTEDWIRARRVKAERDAETRAEIAAERAAEEKRRVARAFLEKQWAIEDAHRASSSSSSSSIEMIKKKPSASASMQTPTTNTNTNTSTTRHETKPRSTAQRVPNPRPVALIDVAMTPCQSLPARRPIDPM